MSVPIVGQPKIIGVAVIIAFHCTCNNSMQVQVGKVKCNKCGKVWLLEAGIKLTFKEIISKAEDLVSGINQTDELSSEMDKRN